MKTRPPSGRLCQPELLFCFGNSSVQLKTSWSGLNGKMVPVGANREPRPEVVQGTIVEGNGFDEGFTGNKLNNFSAFEIQYR